MSISGCERGKNGFTFLLTSLVHKCLKPLWLLFGKSGQNTNSKIKFCASDDDEIVLRIKQQKIKQIEHE